MLELEQLNDIVITRQVYDGVTLLCMLVLDYKRRHLAEH